MDATRRIYLCTACKDKPDTAALFLHFGGILESGGVFNWFISGTQCHGCGTTVPDRRWPHILRPVKQGEKTVVKQPEFTDYDKKLLHALGVCV